MATIFSPKKILITLLGALFVTSTLFLVTPVKALDNNDVSASGSSGVIGLPSGTTYYQNTATLSQLSNSNGSVATGVAGSSILREDKATSVTVVGSPNANTSAKTPTSFNTRAWVIITMLTIAGFCLIAIVWLIVRDSSKNDAELEEELIDEPTAQETEPAEENQDAETAKQNLEALMAAGETVEKEEETSVKTPVLEEKPKSAKKKKNKHGRPAKKRRK